MKKIFLTVSLFIICYLSSVTFVRAFQYSSLPVDNLIQNPWFRDDADFPSCRWSMASWQTTSPASWGLSDKTQDPNDINCVERGNSWWGFAARFAKEGNEQFHPNQDALLWQVVGPVSVNSKTLHFHSLIVAHRVNQYKAEIYGGNSASGPWTSVWTPFNIQNCLTSDCVNETYGQACNTGNRQCLWDDVTQDILGSLSPIQHTIPQGYTYYKIEFLMNYPSPNPAIGTGDVGGKLARVYFKVSGGGGPAPTGTLSPAPSPSPTPTTTPASISMSAPTVSPQLNDDTETTTQHKATDSLDLIQSVIDFAFYLCRSNLLGPICFPIDVFDFIILIKNFGKY